MQTKSPVAPIERAPTPWERRAELGFVQAVWQTFRLVMFKPDVFWASLKPDAPWKDAMLYGWLLTTAGSLLQLPYNLFTLSTMQKQMEASMASAGKVPPEFERVLGWMSEHAVGLSLGSVMASIVLYPLSFLIGGAVIHAGCLLFGAARNGFGATLRVVGYASAPVLVAGVPMVGGLAGFYVLALEIWGIYKVQETTVGKAVGAVLVVTLGLLCLTCGALGAGAFALILQQQR